MFDIYDWQTGKRFDPWRSPPGRKIKFCPIDIIEEKVEEALKRKHQILKNFEDRKKSLKLIEEHITRTEYELRMGIEIYKKIEIEYIDKWIRYWKWFLEKDKQDLDVDTARQYPIQDLYDGKLRRSGPNLTGCCPFHAEKTPSFHIYTRSNRFYCFGCNEGGDVIDYVMKLYNIPFIEAIRRLS